MRFVAPPADEARPMEPVGEIPGRQHHQQAGDDDSTSQETGLEVTETQVTLRVGQRARQDAALDGIDEGDAGKDPGRPSPEQ